MTVHAFGSSEDALLAARFGGSPEAGLLLFERFVFARADGWTKGFEAWLEAEAVTNAKASVRGRVSYVVPSFVIDHASDANGEKHAQLRVWTGLVSLSMHLGKTLASRIANLTGASRRVRITVEILEA